MPKTTGNALEGRKTSVGWTVESDGVDEDEVLQAKNRGALRTNVAAIGKCGQHENSVD